MGHIGVKGLRYAAEGIDLDDSSSSSCEICAKANIKRTPFPQHATHRATKLLQHIHCDVCGPLPSSYGNYKYFILFICCHSRYISLYFMKSRDEALKCFIEFRAAVENFCDERVTILRVDNAPELTKGNFESYCKSEGITYEKMIPDSPNQNGVAERCNLTLGSMARAMLIDADLSNWFWPFAIQTAVHIKNRVPHSALPPHRTPFELWHHHKPNLSHLRPFGVRCTSRIIPNNTLLKFDPRGESGRFLGYARDAKGYLIWVPGPGGRGGTLKARRDVIFHDFHIPAPGPSVNDDLCPLWTDIVSPEHPRQREAPVPGPSVHNNPTPSGDNVMTPDRPAHSEIRCASCVTSPYYQIPDVSSEIVLIVPHRHHRQLPRANHQDQVRMRLRPAVVLQRASPRHLVRIRTLLPSDPTHDRT
jgi:Integrase core domain